MHGNREKEKKRTNLTRQLSNYELTGYYARPGDVLEVFVEADAESPIYQLDGVDFTGKSIYPEKEISNTEEPADMCVCIKKK